MELRLPTAHYTASDYAHWEGDWELWHGQAIAMSPAPAVRHGQLVAELCRQLKNALGEHGSCNCILTTESDWHVADDHIVRPDLSVICGGPPLDQFIDRPPTLIAEVLSPSTENKDRTAKFDLYAAQGVRHYLMVPQGTGVTEAFTLSDGAYAPATADGDTLSFELHPGCVVRVPRELKP